MSSTLKRVWHWVRWPLGALLVLYIGLVAYRIWALGEEEKTQNAVAYIHAQKITLADVMGTNLPPVPNKEKNDATVEGIDANNNGVRDDVELAIFEKYPTSARIRAAELQYAMTEQMFLTRVFDTGTWKAVAEQNSRAFNCISETYPRDNLKKYIQITDMYTEEVDASVYDTQVRKDAKSKAYDFTTSHGDAPGEACDIKLNTLPS